MSKGESKESVIKRIVEDSKGMPRPELLRWAMSQLFRAARTFELVEAGGKLGTDNPVTMGCDATAQVILRHFVQTYEGWEFIRQISPELLRGFKKPLPPEEYQGVEIHDVVSINPEHSMDKNHWEKLAHVRGVVIDVKFGMALVIWTEQVGLTSSWDLEHLKVIRRRPQP